MLKNGLIGIAFVASITGLVISLMNLNTKSVYIEMGKVYDEFYLAKELNRSLESKIKTSKAITDSLYNELQNMSKDVKFKEKKTEQDIAELAKFEEKLYYTQQKFEAEIKKISSENDTKIWNQLNQYIQDFGKKNNCTYIFGANGQGTIMYANEEKNITISIIEYVNARYNGTIAN